jgi:hypothetical protein
MALYRIADIDDLSKQWDKLHAQVEQKRWDLMIEYSLSEKKKIQDIIIDFVKKNKRKLYGGFAMNLLIKDKNPKDAIYTKDDVPDIDIYSPEPITDLMKICNLLHEHKYQNIQGFEAQHADTYSIRVDGYLYCDLSYVPRNIYNKIPFKEISGITLIHPTFMTIDYLRMFSDPLVSWWRMDKDLKSFKRFALLQKHYQLPYSNNSVDIIGSNELIDIGLEIVYNFILDRKTIINVGFYAYNYFLKESKITQLKTNVGKKYKQMTVPYYEFISTEYRMDFFALINKLKENAIIKDKIRHIEYYPFFQFTGNSVEIYVGKDLIAKIYTNNKKCIPCFEVPAILFSDKHHVETKGKTITLGSYQVTLMFSLINMIKCRVENNKLNTDMFVTLNSHLVEMKNYWLDINKKSIINDSLFTDFVINCIGETITPEKQKKMLIQQRKKANKKFGFRYEPAEGKKEPESNYMFSNSSGNLINNDKNLKLADDIKDDVEDENEEKYEEKDKDTDK